jgi:uncharacterized protein YwqG
VLPPESPIIALLPWVTKQARPCWFPVVETGDGDLTSSKFGGIPYLEADEAWPTCRACQRPLELFVQLNLAELPAELGGRLGTGLLQLFYCGWSDDECAGDNGWEPFSDNVSRVRIVTPDGTPRRQRSQNQYEPRRIVGWDREIDYPASAEHTELGIDINYHFNDVPYQPAELTCHELGLHFSGMEYLNALEEAVQSQPSDKLAGWPCWVQGVEYPNCPECGARMQLILQLASEDHVPFMFGDCGIGHITQCTTHKHVVAFGWACS